ncbi:DUF6491 family protein [Pseudomonadales bacterium]|nr:DUF6491 family protein [Pseudomonadales bacterium]MDA9298226.1 DUF6491 family protein [Pseudomonadales bacterium]MDB9868680.1 DUF6491 family protein [Pseudomonadales bacterium]MDB9916487.1 DUF6491 family protein [Pseudomonadales bacterium]MDC1307616.1 DUF6491 family protein [Pseudomonadales bacterium]
MIKIWPTKHIRRSLLAALVCAPLTTVIAANDAQDQVQQQALPAAKRCVSLMRVDRTDVVDDENILFYMKGGEVYVNRLPRRCLGLNSRQAFMYRASAGQLCDVDIISVLESLGSGFAQGPSCGLGSFHPITEEAARELKAQK